MNYININIVISMNS